MAALEPRFGATVGDVAALLPHRPITNTSKPTAEQVAGFVALTSGKVAARLKRSHFEEWRPDGWAGTDEELGDLRESLTAAARSVAAYGAAALTYDAGNPTGTGTAGDVGGKWWERYKEALDELLEAVGLPTEPAPGGEAEWVGPSVAATLPEQPLFTRTMRW